MLRVEGVSFKLYRVCFCLSLSLSLSLNLYPTHRLPIYGEDMIKKAQVGILIASWLASQRIDLIV